MTKIVMATVAVGLLTVSSLSYAANNGGKGEKDPPTAGGTARGDGINLDGSSDDAQKCREGTAGAALCREGMKRR